MRVRSEVTDRTYDPSAMVYLQNPTQIARYLRHGATLFDLTENNDRLVAVFSRRETSELYRLWQKHELK